MSRVGCSMGVGCDEAGVCYAVAHDRSDQCPRNSAPVDVLAVMRRSINLAEAQASQYGGPTLSAYSADTVAAANTVAELIEREAEQRAQLDRVDKVLREFEGMTGSGYQYMAANVRAALARVGAA